MWTSVSNESSEASIQPAPVLQVHGKYIVSGRAVKPSRLAMDDSTASRLWGVSCQLTGITDQELYYA